MLKIKQLRTQKNESQSALAEVIGVSLRTIQNYESGNVDVPMKNLEKIAKHYDVTVAYLFEKVYDELEENHLTNNRVVNDPLEIFNTKSGNTIEELSGGNYLLTVPLVPYHAYATYLSEFEDADYIADLTKVSFIVDRIPRGVYRGFQIKNDSMNDAGPDGEPSRKAILHGDIVLGRQLGRQHWKDRLRTNDFPYWIIVAKTGIMCKEIINHDVENGFITCHSLNNSPEFRDFDLHLNDVLQLFNIIAKQI